MSTHLQGHALGSTTDHLAGTNNTVPATVAAAVVEQAFGTTAVANNLVQRDGGAEITVPLTPTAADRATSKDYVDTQLVTGKTSKELLLCDTQLLNGASGAVLQAILVALATNLVSGDTFIITDGTTTETFTAVAAAPAAFQFIAAGSAAATLTNLVAAINADSTLWDATEKSGLDDYFASSPTEQFIVRRTLQSANNDRIYGVIAGGQAGVKVVEFATGEQDYRQSSGTESDLPSTDPAAKRFGFTRAFAALQAGDTHTIAEDNATFSWDSDDDIWQQTGTGASVTEGDGIDVTGSKITTDVATAAAERKFGAISNRALSDGSAEGAGADAGFLAARTDDTDLNVSASNELQIKPASRLDKFQSDAVWESETSPDKEPTLAELNAALGTTNADRGNKAMLVERSTDYGQVLSAGGAGGIGSTSAFWAMKIANNNVLADYQLVELS